MNRDQTYRCLIVDDEPLARDVLKRYIARVPTLELTGECTNAFERFRKAVSKAFPGFGEQLPGEVGEEKGPAGSPFLYFRSDRKMVKVFVGDIEYIESQKDYVRINTTKALVVTKYSMAALEAMLPESMFLRTHRSFIVALEKVTAHSVEFAMVGEHRVPVGRLYRHAVMKVLGQGS